MTAAEAIRAVNEAFASANLSRATPDVLATLAVPRDSKEFLLSGGLPAGRVFAYDFALVARIPTVRAYAAECAYQPPHRDLDDALCLGDSWGGVLIVLRPPAWNVFTIDLTGEDEDMFVNSNVESLGASLAAYASLAPLRATLAPAKLSAHLEQMLLRIDPPCVERWWSTVVQEVGFGLS